MSMSNETTNDVNDSNTVSEDKSPFTSTALGYIVEHILLAAVLGYDLLHFLPKFIRIAAFDESVVCLAVCLLISCAVGILITWRDRKWQYTCRTWSLCRLDIYGLSVIRQIPIDTDDSGVCSDCWYGFGCI